MSPTATPSPPSAAAAAAGRERRLALETTDDPDVLLRVLVLLRRRGFVVRRVEFSAGDRHAPTRLSIGVQSSTRPAHRLEAWLQNVVGVLGARDE